MSKYLASVLLACTAIATQAQPRLPNKSEIENFKLLAKQTVLHVETSLIKIERDGPTADANLLRREVSQPALALLKEWSASGLSDAVMMSYSSCQGVLGDVQVYAKESTLPPKYHLSAMAQQKLKFISEDLAECRKLRRQLPDFHFAK